MKLRDDLNTEKGYQEIINKNSEFIAKREIKIEKINKDEANGVQSFPKPNTEILLSTYKNMINYKCDNIKAMYSKGDSFSSINENLLLILKYISNNDIVVSYNNLLMLLGISTMMDVNQEDFDSLVKVAKLYKNANNENDFLIDFLIKSRIPSWDLYQKFVVDKPYGNLKKIIDLSEKDKEQASELLKDYIEKLWYKELIEVETHKSKFNIHTGYWSWEAGAIAKILNLDDNALKDQQYYPYDMVHWKD